MSRILLIVCVFLCMGGCGCDDGVLSNEEIIRQTRLCQSAGLNANLLSRSATAEPVRVVCIPQPQ